MAWIPLTAACISWAKSSTDRVSLPLALRAAARKAEPQMGPEASPLSPLRSAVIHPQHTFSIVRLSFRGRPFFPIYSGGSSG